MENLLIQNVRSIILTCSNLLLQPNGEFLVAVDHNQLWTMASETVLLLSFGVRCARPGESENIDPNPTPHKDPNPRQPTHGRKKKIK